MTLERFLAELGSKKGAPGGGAAAALVGASGAALVEMVARLNDVRMRRSSGNALRAARIRRSLQRSIAEDVRVFHKIQKLYRVRKARPAAWQRALKNGAAVPLGMAERCTAAAALASAEKARTSAWLESDRREALILLRAAYDSARLNVEINLKEIRDRAYNDRSKRKLEEWRRKLPRS